ncbi:ATP-grasp domain-containing protein [Spongiivirga citrea]|uniref:Uncharacterized protein n=1 Tax=Spongiivirga citrea TaxID=1481457 RepID=A0A6M0CPN3_9FLAO|nr:hypothetical protein [Spongiivirga citrea]NER17447.1 hypothetical protein [Spongiivirga citrea]
MTDITILTEKKYVQPEVNNVLIKNILEERRLLREALERRGLSVEITNWDNPDYDFSQTKAIVFRTIWDYFERFEEFKPWLEEVSKQTKLCNPKSLISWNVDKHYLQDLSQKGIAIVPTVFVDNGSHRTLQNVCQEMNWKNVIIKPAISGTAFHTYKVIEGERDTYEAVFEKLVGERDMLVQPFIETIATKGEASLMVFNGKYTHAILKKVKTGDYRVQDDFGGTVHNYNPTNEEIAFAEACFKACSEMPAYGRADILWDSDGNILLGELEIVEPELWVRNNPQSAEDFADGILRYI